MINAAVIGLGWWGRHIIQTLENSDRIKVVAATAGRPQLHAEFAEERKLKLHASYDEALADPAVEAVILCTPNTQHEAQVAQAAAAGKQVFCEKPLSLTRASAERMVETARAAGIVLGIGHERRYEPTMEEVATLAASERFGTPMHIEANWSHDILASLDPDNWRGSTQEAPGGAMTGMGVHMTDLFLSLFGPIEAVAARSARRVLAFPTGDVIAVLFRFANGATGQLSVVSATPYYCRMSAFGSGMWIETRDTKHPQHGGETHLVTCDKGADPVSRVVPGRDAVRANLEEWADAVAGRATYRFTDAERIGNVAVLEAIARAAGSGRWEDV